MKKILFVISLLLTTGIYADEFSNPNNLDIPSVDTSITESPIMVEQNVIFSVAPEIGVSSSDIGTVDNQNLWKSYLIGLGWENVQESQDTSRETNYYFGGIVKAEFYKRFSFGLGFRNYDLGSMAANVTGNGNNPNYINLNETVSTNYQEYYVQLGWISYLNKRNKMAIHVEEGYDKANFTDNLTITGYNGNSLNDYTNISGIGDTDQTNVSASYEHDFKNGLNISGDLGYQFVIFSQLNITSVSSNMNAFFNVPKQGTTEKNDDGSNYTVNLNGATANIKLGWSF